MFEDSLVESRIGQISSSRRWTTLASIGVQATIATVVITLPLLHPETPLLRLDAPKARMPLMLRQPPPQVKVHREASASSSAMAAPSEPTRPLILTTMLPSRGSPVEESPSLAPFGSAMGDQGGLPGWTGVGDWHGPVVSVAPPVKAPVLHVSTGVSEGMLIAPIRPAYPAIAKAAHVEGVVVVEAVISRKGTIESLRVMSGPAMLQQAAMEAIREARYQPFRLNGEPTEVQTTITVNFRMGG
jgi:protein TonB